MIAILTEKVSGELEMLHRHLIILKQVVENEPIGILKLAEETRIPSHKVRYSLRILEQEGLIEPSPQGAVTTESVTKAMPILKAKLKDMGATITDIISELG